MRQRDLRANPIRRPLCSAMAILAGTVVGVPTVAPARAGAIQPLSTGWSGSITVQEIDTHYVKQGSVSFTELSTSQAVYTFDGTLVEPASTDGFSYLHFLQRYKSVAASIKSDGQVTSPGFSAREQHHGHYEAHEDPRSPTFLFAARQNEAPLVEIRLAGVEGDLDLVPIDAIRDTCDLRGCTNSRATLANVTAWTNSDAMVSDALAAVSLSGGSVESSSNGDSMSTLKISYTLTRLPDDDHDGIPNDVDNCVRPNPDQAHGDGRGDSDSCE